MFTAEEATKERVATYVEALENEKVGYEQRMAAKKAGRRSSIGEDLTAEQLAGRVKEVEAEIKRAKGIKPATADEGEPEAEAD